VAVALGACRLRSSRCIASFSDPFPRATAHQLGIILPHAQTPMVSLFTTRRSPSWPISIDISATSTRIPHLSYLLYLWVGCPSRRSTAVYGGPRYDGMTSPRVGMGIARRPRCHLPVEVLATPGVAEIGFLPPVHCNITPPNSGNQASWCVRQVSMARKIGRLYNLG
jgi:hypothetical protein